MTKIEFGTDGVRGEAGVWPIDVSGAAQIGHGIGALLDRQTAEPKVLVGRDTRQSGEELAAALARGLSLHNVQIVDAGVMTTAGVAYLTKHLNMDAGVVISASHNPWTENGIKIIGPDGCKLSDEQERAIEQAVNQPIDAANNKVKGHVQQAPELVETYIDHLVGPFKDVDLSRLTLALDCSNGAASAIASRCFERLGCQPFVTHADPDGTNINHGCGSEIVREGRGELAGIVTSHRLHLGAAFDGDADRVVLIDETGRLVDGDHILYILATRFKNENRLPGNVIVTTSMANRGLDTALANQGIQVIRTPVGDKYILRELQNNGYVLGGEQSGHILIYDEMHTTGDGIYTALFIASILAQTGCPPLSRLASPLQKYPQVIVSARVASKPDLQTLPAFQREHQKIAEHLGPGAVINARYSGTEPLFRVMIEGMFQHQLADIAQCAVGLGRSVQASAGNSNGLIEVKDCTTGTTLSLEDLQSQANGSLTICGEEPGMAKLEPTMFREYDLRGRLSKDELNEESVAIIARAYGTMLRKRDLDKVVVGYDLRTGSKEMCDVAMAALQATGVDVIALGRVLTPMMYAAQYHYQTKGGMMITASHNPNGWLGFKLALGFSYTLGPVEMAELKELTESEAFAQGQGTLETIENYVDQYTEDVISKIHIPKKVKAVVNAGNGTAGPIAPDILRKANCEIVEFLTEPDLSFKHYFPNPSREDMMRDTGRETVNAGAQIGLAFDGDGDRLGVTDEKGNVVWPDQYMILLSREILKEIPGSSIIFDVKSTRALAEDVKKHGGKPVMWKTGHSYIKEKLNELEAPLAGEMSGHIFFGKPYYYGFDDAVFSALKLVEMLSRSDKTFSQMIAETPHYISSPTLNARCPDEIKYDVVAEIVRSFQNDGYEVVTFDNNPRLGGRIEFPDGWALVRASSNLPILVLRFEATTEERLEELKNMVRQKFSAYPPEQIGRDWESG